LWTLKWTVNAAKWQFVLRDIQQKPSGLMVAVVASRPWEYAGVDFVGPLPRTAQGHAHILVFVDYFTKWVEICAVREATAVVVADKFMENIVARHGAPTYLISDRGTPFVNTVFDSLLRRLGTEHRLTTAYHPQTNMTERVNRTLKTAIRAFVGGMHRSWDRFIPHLSFALRTAPHASTGDTPAFLLYGRDLHTPLDLLLTRDAGPAPHSMQDYREGLVAALKVAYARVWDCLAESHAVQKKQYDRRRQHVTFKINDLVKVRDHPRSDGLSGFAAKLAPVFKGPFRVSQRLSDVNYRLTSLQDGRDIGVFHVVNMCPFYTWDSAISKRAFREKNKRKPPRQTFTYTSESLLKRVVVFSLSRSSQYG
uniref:Integrase catalytic domain-containing protein n=1 Tax=Paramormyrops kingsleyae TaxID=1676925 RepID=A0A3B3Q2E9_9TELE